MCVGVLVGVGVSGVVVVRKQRGNTGAAFREEEEEEEEEEACVTFFLFGGDAQIPKGTPLSLWGKKMTTDRKYVRARGGGGGLEHRFSFICVVVDVSRRGSAPTVSVLRVSFPRFFVFPRDAFLRGRERDCERKWLPPILSLSFSLSLSYRARFAETTTEWFRWLTTRDDDFGTTDTTTKDREWFLSGESSRRPNQ